MSELMIPLDITDIIERPEAYEIETVGAAVDFLKNLIRSFKEKDEKLTAHIIKKMKDDNATKLIIKDIHGKEKVVTLATYSPKCDDPHASERYGDAGFDINEIGEFVFKPSWSKAKKARKMGGEKQRIIDNLFQEGNPYLKIEEV